MKRKMLFAKIIIDICMLILMTIIMGYHIILPITHEVIGIILFVLYFLHIGLNYKWFIGLFKGKYSLSRVYRTILNLALLIIMILIILSSLMISLKVFKFSSFGNVSTGRTIHLVCTMWCFILVSMHFGVHLDMIKNMFLKHLKPKIYWIFRVAFVLSFGYMIYVLIDRKLIDILFHTSAFAFFPYNDSMIKFLFDYVEIIIAFMGLSYYINKGLIYLSKLKYKKEV